MSLNLSHLADHICPPFARPVLDRVKGSPIARRLASGAFWSVIGNGLAKGLTFVALVLVARLLGEKAYGEFGFVRSTALMFIAFSSAGIGTAATKYIAELLHSDKERVGRIIGLTYIFTFIAAIFVSGVLYVATPWLCETWLNKPHLVGAMRCGAVLLFIQTMIATQVGIVSGIQDFRGLALASFVAGLFVVPCCVLGAMYAGVGGALLGLAISGCFNIAVNSIVIFFNTKKYKIRYDFYRAFRESRILWQYNLPTFLSNLVFIFAYWYCQVILVTSSASGVDIGIAYAAIDIHVMIQYLPVLVGGVFLPILSQYAAVPKMYWKTVRLYGISTLAFTLLAIIPIVIFSRTVLSVYGDSFMDGYPTLIVICLFLLPFLLNSAMKTVLQSRNSQWWIVFYHSVFAVVSVGVCRILVDLNWGSLGLASGLLAGSSVQLAVQMFHFRMCPTVWVPPRISYVIQEA